MLSSLLIVCKFTSLHSCRKIEKDKVLMYGSTFLPVKMKKKMEGIRKNAYGESKPSGQQSDFLHVL